MIELYPSIYCLYFKNMEGNTEMYLQKDLLSDSKQIRIDLYESEEAVYKWIAQEQEVMLQKGRDSMYALYDQSPGMFF